MNSISKIAARWLKVSEEEAMNHLYEFQDHTHPPKQLTRDALSAALDDDSPYTSEECVQYLLEQIQREDSDSEEIDRMLSFLGHRSTDGNKESCLKVASYMDELNDLYPVAGEYVDGLLVREDVPNTSSIESSFKVLGQIREVPVGEGFSGYANADDQRRVEELAEAIEQSGEINPLIAVVDESGDEGLWILEGSHRAAALTLLGKQSFPAMVAIDTENILRSQLSSSGIQQGSMVYVTHLEREAWVDYIDYEDTEMPLHLKTEDGGSGWFSLENVELMDSSKQSSLSKEAVDYSDELGNSHRFLISPEGSLHHWDKASGGYGEAMSDLEMADMEDADEDLLTDMKLNMGDETFKFYKEDGWATGVTSSGNFALLNSPQITPGQASTFLEIVRNNGLKNVVIHEGGVKQFFSNSRELMNFLSPIANS